MQSTLAPQGPHARAIAGISWIMFAAAALILSVVMLLALHAAYRKSGAPRPVSANALIVGGGVIFPVLALTALLAYGVHAMAGLRLGQQATAPLAEVTGHQWWWEVRYRDGAGGMAFVDANELHIPAGMPVTIALASRDVIHSFWIPTLAGKIDLIPGRTNHIVLHADQPGVYRGQCAEFCGAQHARMAFVVVARSAADHQAWMTRQAAGAAGEAVPASPLLRQGRQAFRDNNCMACHAVGGQPAAAGAASRPGPDLGRVGARRALLANTLENSRDNLSAVIARSQEIKPGSGMPSYAHIDAASRESMAAWLESLQ